MKNGSKRKCCIYILFIVLIVSRFGQKLNALNVNVVHAKISPLCLFILFFTFVHHTWRVTGIYVPGSLPWFLPLYGILN